MHIRQSIYTVHLSKSFFKSVNIWCIINQTKHSSNALLSLVWFSMHQTLQYFSNFYLLWKRNFPVEWPDPSQPGTRHLWRRKIKKMDLYKTNSFSAKVRENSFRKFEINQRIQWVVDKEISLYQKFVIFWQIICK